MINNSLYIHYTRRTMLIIPALLLMLSSCSNLRYLEEDQKLYTGSKIKIETTDKISNKSEVSDELKQVLRPKPNERFLFMRTRLWFYNIAGEDPQGRIRKWVKTRIGRPPVLWEEFDGQRGSRLIENRLFNMGFFDASVHFEPKEKNRKASAEFTVNLSPAFQISHLNPIESDHELAQEVNSVLDQSILRPGNDYRLSKLREERERITKHLRDQGYFYFHDDYLLFLADTTVGTREVMLTLTLKNNIPKNAQQQFKIRNTIIDANHSLDPGQTDANRDSIVLEDGVLLLNNNDQFKPATLKNAVFFERAVLYNTRDNDLSINHLIGLGVFKFVNIRFSEVHERDTAWLDVNVMLTPMEKKTLSTELRGVSKSNDFAGPGLSASFNNRNFLKGAENFSVSLDGSYEMLIGGKSRASSLEAGITSELVIPRFVAPFGIRNISPLYIPKTRMSLALNYLTRTDAFSVSSIKSQFGYEWNNTITTQHRFNPLVFNVFALGSISSEYEEFFSQEVLLRRGLFEQFLLGSDYSFIYNSQLKEKRKHSWYFNYNIDLSGNILHLLLKGVGLGTPNDNGEYGILNRSYSQYSKSDFDVRYYLDMGHGQRLVSRFAAGVGIPYGNSSTLPYVKLFTSGGSNSIRAFQPRSLGPGAYYSPDTLQSSFNIYQSGEIKLEFNLEYRIEFTNIIKGALFADAGNVWNLEERDGAPGGQFKRSEFMSQIALGTGLGFRFDFTFFILRLDIAFPLAVPFDDSPGYFQSIRPHIGSWRRNNIVYNLAIGYPF